MNISLPLCSIRIQSHMYTMNDQGIRRITPDVSVEINKLASNNDVVIETKDEVQKTECVCCGIIEECTVEYIVRVKDSYCGKWVCGLCSEAVKELLTKAVHDDNDSRSILMTMEEALSSHSEICHKFNKTTILNPKLSLARAMSDIAKRSSKERISLKHSRTSNNIARSSSCIPSIGLE